MLGPGTQSWLQSHQIAVFRDKLDINRLPVCFTRVWSITWPAHRLYMSRHKMKTRPYIAFVCLSPDHHPPWAHQHICPLSPCSFVWSYIIWMGRAHVLVLDLQRNVFIKVWTNILDLARSTRQELGDFYFCYKYMFVDFQHQKWTLRSYLSR